MSELPTVPLPPAMRLKQAIAELNNLTEAADKTTSIVFICHKYTVIKGYDISVEFGAKEVCRIRMSDVIGKNETKGRDGATPCVQNSTIIII
jgi:hypothetical protein